MKLISVNIGLPVDVILGDGKIVTTGIFKEPVEGEVMLRTLNLDGDKQADLTVHGGASKAVYGYPSEHYEFWRKELPDMKLSYGMFGENFTVEGMFEDSLYIGDRFRVGEAEIMVTEPRLPCYKLGIKFGRSDILKRFLVSRRTGFYFAVLKEGEVGAGDKIEPLERDRNRITVSDITRLYAFEKSDLKTLPRALEVEALPKSWRDYFRKQLEKYS
jgi:MOSC domain-containing protein YiiM